MEFDATFLIAVISFLCFIFVMNKIFYAPIIKIMQERQSFVEQNFEAASDTKKETQKQISYRNNELEKSREEARSLISQQAQILKSEKNRKLSDYKNELYSNIANQRENLRTSALDAKETLKDNVVDIAKDISQMLLGETIDKEAIDKSKIEE